VFFFFKVFESLSQCSFISQIRNFQTQKAHTEKWHLLQEPQQSLHFYFSFTFSTFQP